MEEEYTGKQYRNLTAWRRGVKREGTDIYEYSQYTIFLRGWRKKQQSCGRIPANKNTAILWEKYGIDSTE
jgi:hypothetical protein